MRGKRIGWYKKALVSSSGLLLDTYNAAFAVSLRQLKTGVTNVIRVRRESDDAESDFTPTEITNGTLTTWVGGGYSGYITTWYDQSGNGNDAINPTTATQPLIVGGGNLVTEYGRPAISFTDDLLYVWKNTVAPVLFQDISDSISVFNVHISTTSPATAGAIWYCGRTLLELKQNRGTGTKAPIILGTNLSKMNYNVTDDHASGTERKEGTATVTLSTQYLTSHFINGDDLSMFLNGGADGTLTYTIADGDRSVGGVENSTLSIGVRSKNTGVMDSEFLSGRFQEIILMKTYEGANRTDIEANINTHYSIY